MHMPRYVITAPQDLALTAQLDGPLVYLAGPMQGAANWQRDAIEVLGDFAPDLHVACPRARVFRGGTDEHLAWERTYTARAMSEGVILCWLARERAHRCSRSYGAQVRFELGAWAAQSARGELRLVVGIERGFADRAYLVRRLTLDYPQVPICRTLRQACAAAAELAIGSTHLALPERFVPHIGLRVQ